MAKIKMMWLTGGMSGRADKTSNTYTKQDRHTGAVYATTLRNPVSGKDFNNAQIGANNKFGALCMGINLFVKAISAADASAEDKAQYAKYIAAFKRQSKYPTLRTFLFAKGIASVNADYSQVTISDANYSKVISIAFNARPLVEGNGEEEFNGSNGSSGSNSGSSENVTISLTAVGNGKVSIDGGTAGVSKSKSVAPGTQVAILATPDTGATFTQWSDGNTEASRNVTVNAAMSLSATFTGGNAGGGDGPSEG